MPSATYYAQDCPTCGRKLQIRVEYLGKRVACQHCQGTFIASDNLGVRCDPADHGSVLLRRANELLNTVAEQSSLKNPRVVQ